MATTDLPPVDNRPVDDGPPVDDIPFVAEQIAEQQRADREATSELDASARRRRRRLRLLRPILWRLHFVGGFLAAPVVVSLAITGILFAWSPQLDGWRFGAITDSRSASAAGSASLADQARAAQAAHPSWGVFAVTPAHDGRNTAVLMDPPGGEEGFGAPSDGVDVYVDGTGAVTGSVARADRSEELFRSLHSSWTLGDDVRPVTELAAAWFLVSLLSGLYLWWPSLRRRGSAAFAVRRRMRGRRGSKDWHNAIGVALVVPMLLVAVTGLTWTGYAGERYDQIRDSLFTVAPGGADPALPREVPGASRIANLDVVGARVREAELTSPVQITVPADDRTGWTARSLDATFPLERDEIVVDGASGAVVGSYDSSTDHWLNKLRTAGILFHQAQLFGWPLQVFMSLLAVGVVALVAFGYRMWWQRRPSGGLGAPPPIRDWLRRAPLSLLAIIAVLAWLLPLLGLSLVGWLVLERGWRWSRIVRRSRGPSRGADVRADRVAADRFGVLDAIKATVLGVLGSAMLAAPGLGEGREELATIPRLLTWAWSRPLGLVLLVVGLVGLAALVSSRRAGDRDGSVLAM